jgi:predicted acetyltransferase
MKSIEEAQLIYEIVVYSFKPSPSDLTNHTFRQAYCNVITQCNVIYFKDNTTNKPVCSSVGIPMTQNIRGKILPAYGLGSVCALPEVRRNGLVRRLLKEHFHQAYEKGVAISGLYPFKDSFYQRLGYFNFPMQILRSFNPLQLQPLLKNKKIEGKVTHAELDTSTLQEYYDFLQKLQKDVHGMSLFDTNNRIRLLAYPEKFYVAYARDKSNAIVGTMVYNTKGLRTPMSVKWFDYINANGKYLLLQFIALHGDQVNEVQLHLPPNASTELWVNDLNDVNGKIDRPETPARSQPMGRIISVERLAGISIPFEATHKGLQFTAKIIDEDCQWNNGYFRFESGKDGTLAVSKENKGGEFTLTIQGLAAVIFCGVPLSDLEMLDFASGCTDEMRATVATMFPQTVPYVHQVY